VTNKYQERDPLDEIKMAFRLFVGDDVSGKISVRSLRRVARELNE
jgi:Ca2+-binding EF-hand superfamily protein